MAHRPAGRTWSLTPAFAGAAATFSGIGLARFAYVPLFPAMVAASWATGPEGGFLGEPTLPATSSAYSAGGGWRRVSERLARSMPAWHSWALHLWRVLGTEVLLGSRCGGWSLAWQEDP